MKIQAAPTPVAPPNAPTPAPPKEEVAEINGDQVTLYEIGPDGKPVQLDTGHHASAANLLDSKVFLPFFPSNMASSVSKDYLPTRGAAFLHDMSVNALNYSVGAATASALGMSPVWGGAAMATFNMIKDRLCQTTGFLSTFAAPVADKNPRPWMLAGDAVDLLGGVYESSVALAPQGAFLPIALSAPVIRVMAGGMRGVAMANIEPRQALADNLGEMRAKNGNQSFVAGLIGGGMGYLAVRHLFPTMGAATYPAVSAVAAAAGILAQALYVSCLDFHPVNSQAVGKIVAHLDTEKSVPSPTRNPVSSVWHIFDGPHLEMGASVKPLLEDQPRFQELKELYKDRNYILEFKDGKPTVILKEGSGPEDRFLAAMQLVRAQNLAATPEYADKIKQAGQKEADHWLVTSSMQKSPKEAGALLSDLKKAGWSTDMLRFHDSGLRVRFSQAGDNKEDQFELPLPEPAKATQKAPEQKAPPANESSAPAEKVAA